MGILLKAIAVGVSMLGALLMSALVVFIVESGVLFVGAAILYAAGMLPEVPHRYEVMTIWLMVAIALFVPGIGWARYILLVARQG